MHSPLTLEAERRSEALAIHYRVEMPFIDGETLREARQRDAAHICESVHSVDATTQAVGAPLQLLQQTAVPERCIPLLVNGK